MSYAKASILVVSLYVLTGRGRKTAMKHAGVFARNQLLRQIYIYNVWEAASLDKKVLWYQGFICYF